MAEKLDLTTPQTFPSITEWKMVRIDKNRKERYLLLVAESNTGVEKERLIKGLEAMTVMRVLNTANNQIKSEERRALEYMRDQGDFAGTISGAPD